MRSTGIKIFLASLLLLSLSAPGESQPTPAMSKQFADQVPTRIFTHWVNPLPKTDLTKTAIVVYFELANDGKTSGFDIVKENVFWKTETDLSKEDLSTLKLSVIDSIKKAEPLPNPNSPQSLLKKVGVIYYFKPGLKQPGEIKVVHP